MTLLHANLPGLKMRRSSWPLYQLRLLLLLITALLGVITINLQFLHPAKNIHNRRQTRLLKVYW